jgi:hypothetical protein
VPDGRLEHVGGDVDVGPKRVQPALEDQLRTHGGSEMDDHVGIRHQPVDQGRIQYAAFHQLACWMPQGGIQIAGAAGGEVVRTTTLAPPVQ